MEWDDLEDFISVGTRTKKSTITINGNLTITFNTGFMKNAKDWILDNEYTCLSYSNKNKAVIFEFTKAKKEGSLKLTKQINMFISARTFLNYNSLDIKNVKGTYTPELFDIPGKGKCWGILLNSKTKKCSKCGEEKTLDSFRLDKSGAYGRRSKCKECEKNK